MLWSLWLKYLVKTGDLTVIDANGKTHRYGNAAGLPSASIRLHDKKLHAKLFFSAELSLGEAYMDGTLTIEKGTLKDFLTILALNLASFKPILPKKLTDKITPIAQAIQQHNPVGKAKTNVAPHYDLSDKLFETFLDPSWQYSCAYYTDPGNSLEQAQRDKMRHIASKMRLEPGMKVLDIGSGWGGLALYLARTFDVDVTGVSLSGEQVKKANDTAKAAGLDHKVRFLHTDVREVAGTFDRIVSVGMMEHVGVPFYAEIFATIMRLLAPDGNVLLHFIGNLDGPSTTNAWLRKYIFPGGYAPALSEISKVIEKSGLLMTDIEVLRLHYAYTLRDWYARFRAQWDVVAQLYDRRFCRMWEFYLVGCELEFLYMGTGVYQIQMAKDINALPIIRDYMIDAERTLTS